MIDVGSNGGALPPQPPPPQHLHHHHHPLLTATDTSSGGSDDGGAPPPKRRAETWAQDETRALISLRKEIDSSFNTSKSNKHLWEKISKGMRERGFERSPNMCTDKWRNLLKEYKKARGGAGTGTGTGTGIGIGIGNVNGKGMMTCYKEEIEEILRERNKSSSSAATAAPPPPPPPVVDSCASFGIEDPSIPYGPMEASGRPTLNLERRLDHEGHPLAITAADTVAANGGSPWNWRETPVTGEPCTGRVITVKWGDYTKRIGIDATPDAIKEAIKSSFRLRTTRAFWLEDEDDIVRALDRDMPVGTYTLHLDEGITIKVCLYEDPDHVPVHAEDTTFYSEGDFKDFISRRGWTCLREFNGYRNINSMNDLCPGAIYRGVN